MQFPECEPEVSQFNTSLVSIIRNFIGLQSALWCCTEGGAEGAAWFQGAREGSLFNEGRRGSGEPPPAPSGDLTAIIFLFVDRKSVV